MIMDLPNYKIVRNSATCLLCGDEIESKHRHDYVSCKCGEIFVDGGKDYIRRGAGDFNNLKDTSESREWTVEEYQKRIEELKSKLESEWTGDYLKGLYQEEVDQIEKFIKT